MLFKKGTDVAKTGAMSGVAESLVREPPVAVNGAEWGKEDIIRPNFAEGFPPLPREKFSILYADPPWDYKGQLQHNGAGGQDTGGALRHYPTVPVPLMKQWPIDSIAEDDALLFMWATSPHLDQAIDLGKGWGFDWATVAFIWDKQKVNPGFYTMSQCELCLVFKRGKIPRPRGSRKERQLISICRGRHSAKPDEARRRITAMFPDQSKIELFARQRAKGWSAWGLDAY